MTAIPRGRHKSMVLERQEPLRRRYRTAPHEALITDGARTVPHPDTDPLHGHVAAGHGHASDWFYGIHRAVGGMHDAPNPGDILCAALAACQESTLRMIADRLGLTIEHLEIHVAGQIDTRGTLAVDLRVPVGFQHIDCRVDLRLAGDPDPSMVKHLLAGAERSCVVLQTLRHGVPVTWHQDTSDPQDSDTELGD